MKIYHSSKVSAPLLWCWVLLTLGSCTCTDEPIANNPYRWDNEMLPMSMDPFYHEGTYFAFPTDFSSGVVYLAGMDEYTGDTLFYHQFPSGLPYPDRNSRIFYEDNEVLFQVDRYIFHIDPSSGNTLSIDTFPNYVWSSYKTERYFSGCSYNSDLDFYYYEFVKEDGAYKIDTLHQVELGSGEQLSGAPPFRNNEDWILHTNNRFSSNNYESCIVRVRSQDATEICTLFAVDRAAFNVYDYGKSYIVYHSNRLMSVEKSDLAINWVVPSSSSSGILLDNKLYILAASDAATEEGLMIIDLESGQYESIESNPSLGSLQVRDHQIAMIQYGEFRVFNTMTKDWDFVSDTIQSRTGYQPHFRISPNSVLFWDMDGWHCFPY